MMKLIVSAFFVTGFFIKGYFSLYCFGCNANVSHPATVPYDVCASKRNPTHLVNISCPELSQDEKDMGAVPVCYKVVESMFYFTNETFSNERGCTSRGGKIDFCGEIRRNNSEKKCFLCDTETCNEASDMQIIRFMMFFLAIAIVLYMHEQMERNHLRDSKPFRW